MEKMIWALTTNVLSVPRFMYLVQMIPSVKRYVMGGFMVYIGLKTVTIPQDKDLKEGDFLLLSEWNVLVEQV